MQIQAIKTISRIIVPLIQKNGLVFLIFKQHNKPRWEFDAIGNKTFDNLILNNEKFSLEDLHEKQLKVIIREVFKRNFNIR